MTSNGSDHLNPRAEKRYVLYLTPAESDVWTSVQVLAQEHGDELLVDIPVDQELLVRKWRLGTLKCSSAEYLRAIRKLTETGILADRGFVAKMTKRRCAFSISPEAFLTVNVSRRSAYWESPSEIAPIKHTQRHFLQSATAPSREEILQEIEEFYLSHGDGGKARSSALNLCIMLLGKWAREIFPSDGALQPEGMFHAVGEHEDRYIVAFPGYEPFRLHDERFAPKLGARLVILPQEGTEDGSSTLYLAPPSSHRHWHDFEDTLPYHDDGELRTDWLEGEALGQLSLEELERWQRFCQCLKSHVDTWSSALGEAFERRQREEEERARKAQEIERLGRELAEAERAAKEAERRKHAIEEQMQNVEDPPRRSSRPVMLCRSCGECPVVPGEWYCRDCLPQ